MAENTKVIAEYNDIKAVADAIRTKKNITGDMLLKDMPSNVLSIEGGLDTSDATITPETVFLNETGYANGEKVTGTFTIEEEVTAQENLIAQISAALEGKAGCGSGGSLNTTTVTFNRSMCVNICTMLDENGNMKATGSLDTRDDVDYDLLDEVTSITVVEGTWLIISDITGHMIDSTTISNSNDTVFIDIYADTAYFVIGSGSPHINITLGNVL